MYDDNFLNVNSFAVDIIFSKKIIKNATVGLGLCLENSRIKETFEKPYFFNEEDNIFLVRNEGRRYNFLSPGFVLSTELQFPINHLINIFIHPKYKIIYMGNKYHAHPLDSWITFTVFGGFRFNI